MRNITADKKVMQHITGSIKHREKESHLVAAK